MSVPFARPYFSGREADALEASGVGRVEVAPRIVLHGPGSFRYMTPKS